MLVSAIIPTYNRAHLICRAIESVLAQSYHSLELIIIDDGSTDLTEKVIKRYADSSSIVLKYFKKTNGGCSSARNKGVEIASGEFIAFLDSDDQWLPNAISMMVETLERSCADFVYSPVYEVYGDIYEILSYPASAGIPELFCREHFLTTKARPCSVMYRKEIFSGLSLDESLKYNEDSDFLQRVAIKYKAAYLAVPTAKVFNHEENKSSNRVGIYSALLKSSLGILQDFPGFAESMGDIAETRILGIKMDLIEQLVVVGDLGTALSVAGKLKCELRSDVCLSLMLRSSTPLRLSLSVQKIIKKTMGYLELRKTIKCSMNVMHLFGTYLPMTENWCYRLIKHLPDTQLYIVAEKPDNEGVFALPNSLCLIMPTAEWPMAPHPIIKTGAKLVCIFLRKLWMRLLIHFAGKSSIIHAHFSYMGWNYLSLAKMNKVPMVVSFYGYDYECLPNREPIWRERYSEMFRQVSMFITEGSVGRNKLIAMGCPEDKVKVVHLGVETSLIPFYKRTKKAGELKLVQVATFTSKKGHEVTVKAFILASERCPGIRLTLVGTDKEGIRGALQQSLADAGLDSYVEFIDGIDFKKLHTFLKPYHLFIHPSMYGKDGDSEGGAPVVLLDAQATGMPVLATTHCDIPEEVIHGETGILVGEGDYIGLAGGIERFYNMDTIEYAAYCERARKHVETDYDSVDSGKLLKEVYEQVVNNFDRRAK